jgi:hypothetical protein
MKLHRRLATVFVILALAGCTRVATEPGQAPYAPYSPDNDWNVHDRGGDGDGGGGGMM